MLQLQEEEEPEHTDELCCIKVLDFLREEAAFSCRAL